MNTPEQDPIPTPRTLSLINGMHESVSVEGVSIEHLNIFIEHAKGVEQELHQANEKIKALEEDGKMLDWLESEEGKQNFYLSDNITLYDGKEIRQAIRNAMEKGQ